MTSNDAGIDQRPESDAESRQFDIRPERGGVRPDVVSESLGLRFSSTTSGHNVPPAAVAALVKRCVRRRFRRGEVIFREGDAGDSVHVIKSGCVMVLSNGIEGEPIALNLLSDDAWIGELALLGQSTRTATVRALDSTETLSLSRPDFDELRRRFPVITDVLLDVLAEKVRRVSCHTVELVELKAEQRIFRWLRRSGELFRVGRDGGVIPLSQDQIASLAGAGIRITNKTLAEARHAGLIKTGKGKITIVNWNGICEAAE